MYDKLIARKTELGLSKKEIERLTGIPLRTLARMFSLDETDHKRGIPADNLHKVLKVLNLTFEELFEDATAFVGNHHYEALQHRIDELTAEVELLKLHLAHKDELLAVHNYYTQRIKEMEN